MKSLIHRIAACVLGVFLALQLIVAAAQAPAPWEAAETARQALFAAQLALMGGEQQEAQGQLETAQTALRSLAQQLQPLAPAGATALLRTTDALQLTAPAQFAAARSQVWTAVLGGATEATLAAVAGNDPDAAQQWLKVRAFRTSTRVTRTATDATEALAGWRGGTISAAQASEAIRADLFDTYMALANTALTGVADAAKRQNATGAAENAGLGAGYFAIIREVYVQQRGADQADQVDKRFNQLVQATTNADWNGTTTGVTGLQDALRGFAPTALSAEETAKKGTQILQFINLLQLEYAKGIRNGVVTVPLEVQEARTFHTQATALLNELTQSFTTKDAAATQQLTTQLQQIGAILDQTGDPEQVTTLARSSMALLSDRLGISNQGGDISTITTLLNEVQTAVATGDYETAEATRLQAYAIYEVTAEPKLLSRDGALGSELEALFWQGTQSQKGLATLIAEKAKAEAFAPTLAQLTSGFATAQTLLTTQMTPTGAIIGSIAILIREGLEAVLVIGAILGYMRATKAPKTASNAVLGGAGIGILLSFVVWGLAQTVLTITPINRELFEGLIGLVAAAILVYVTNWLLHKAYVTDWMAFIKQQVQQALGRGSVFGLATLGFMVVFREGFETVLFFQALLFDAPAWSVAVGAILGLLIIGVIAFAILRWSVRLPLKPFFTVTSALLMILAVSFVGNGLRSLQEAGWVGVTRLDGIPIGYIPALFGLFPTVETVLGQVLVVLLLAVTFAIAKLRSRKIAVAAAGRAA